MTLSAIDSGRGGALVPPPAFASPLRGRKRLVPPRVCRKAFDAHLARHGVKALKRSQKDPKHCYEDTTGHPLTCPDAEGTTQSQGGSSVQSSAKKPKQEKPMSKITPERVKSPSDIITRYGKLSVDNAEQFLADLDAGMLDMSSGQLSMAAKEIGVTVTEEIESWPAKLRELIVAKFVEKSRPAKPTAKSKPQRKTPAARKKPTAKPSAEQQADTITAAVYVAAADYDREKHVSMPLDVAFEAARKVRPDLTPDEFKHVLIAAHKAAKIRLSPWTGATDKYPGKVPMITSEDISGEKEPHASSMTRFGYVRVPQKPAEGWSEEDVKKRLTEQSVAKKKPVAKPEPPPSPMSKSLLVSPFRHRTKAFKLSESGKRCYDDSSGKLVRTAMSNCTGQQDAAPNVQSSRQGEDSMRQKVSRKRDGRTNPKFEKNNQITAFIEAGLGGDAVALHAFGDMLEESGDPRGAEVSRIIREEMAASSPAQVAEGLACHLGAGILRQIKHPLRDRFRRFADRTTPAGEPMNDDTVFTEQMFRSWLRSPGYYNPNPGQSGDAVLDYQNPEQYALGMLIESLGYAAPWKPGTGGPARRKGSSVIPARSETSMIPGGYNIARMREGGVPLAFRVDLPHRLHTAVVGDYGLFGEVFDLLRDLSRQHYDPDDSYRQAHMTSAELADKIREQNPDWTMTQVWAAVRAAMGSGYIEAVHPNATPYAPAKGEREDAGILWHNGFPARVHFGNPDNFWKTSYYSRESREERVRRA